MTNRITRFKTLQGRRNRGYAIGIKFLILPLLLFCLACNTDKDEKSDTADEGPEVEIKFDQKKWSTRDGRDYPYRDQMLNDVVYNDSIRSLYEDEIIGLLGEPDRRNDGYLYYMIAQKRLGIWALHTKTMVIKLDEDGAIDWIKIHE